MQTRLTILPALLFTATVFACNGSDSPSPETAETDNPAVKVGAERLFEEYRHLVEGKRVGLITNHSALVNGHHLADLLHGDPGIELTVMFGPEHGIRGSADAGQQIDHSVDEQTGLPVYSLYGPVPRPTMEMLEEVDTLLFDIQDVGARFYTYLITMGRSMISAAEAGIPYVVLDRPNPLGGKRMEGPLLEDRHHSSVGIYPIPVTHGMTAGELARMIQGEEWHGGLRKLDLHVVAMKGWNRQMLWPDTGLEWVPPSPNLPDFETALVYPGTCLFEGTRASEGRGTRSPFLKIGSPGLDPKSVSETFNARNLSGLRAEPAEFIPVSIPGMATRPKLEDETLFGVSLVVTDPESVTPLESGVHLLEIVYRQLSGEERRELFIDGGLEVRFGNESLRKGLEQKTPVSELTDWSEPVDRFRSQRHPYLIYDEL